MLGQSTLISLKKGSLDFPKQGVELLASRLLNLLASELLSKFRSREKNLDYFFYMEDALVACNNVEEYLTWQVRE